MRLRCCPAPISSQGARSLRAGHRSADQQTSCVATPIGIPAALTTISLRHQCRPAWQARSSICAPSQQGQSAFKTACERTLCGFTSVTEITRGAPAWLAGIGGMLDSAHSGAPLGPEATFLCRRPTACATAPRCRRFSRWYSIKTVPARLPVEYPLGFSRYIREFSGFRPDCSSLQTKRGPGCLRAIRRPWGRVYKSMILPQPAGKQTVRVIRNSPAQAFADLHLIVSKVLISARRA